MEHTLKKIVPRKPAAPTLVPTAAYARVSSGKDAMLESLSAQVSIYSKLIQSHPGWQYMGVYADESCTGTKDSRPEFMRLLADCRAGKIKQVLVKSISRFARNTVTLLEVVRELRALGVDIYFERENIHTLSADGELMLSLIAAVAQEESRSASENCKWQIRKWYEEGHIKGGLTIFGYRWADGEYRLVPDEASVVVSIYRQYLSGMTVHEILGGLTRADNPAPRNGRWTDFAVRYILRNERYIGDTLLQKDFIVDHLSKRRATNRGQLPQYYVSDTHEAIIDRNDFERVQALMDKRARTYAAKTPGTRLYPFSGIIICGKCGKPFARKVAHGKASWNCGTFIRKGKQFCHGKQIPEDVLYQHATDALGLSAFSQSEFSRKVSRILVPAPNRLVFELADGQRIEREWNDRSRSERWDEAARARASEQAKARYTR